jgi:hypothetical protein
MKRRYVRNKSRLPTPEEYKEATANVKAAFSNLADRGVSRSALSKFAPALYCAALLEPHNNIWPPPGTTLRRIKWLPRTLRSLAQQIGTLNANRFVNPRFWLPIHMGIDPGKRQGRLIEEVRVWKAGNYNRLQEVVRSCQSLPYTLDWYAKFLVMHASRMGRSKRRRFHHPGILNKLKINLVNLVQQSTGKPHYREVAEFISAIFGIAGLDIVSTESLKALCSRNSKSPRI